MDTLVSTIFLAFLGIHVLILPFDGVHCATKSSICNQTPYPEVCNSFLDAHTLGTVDETPFRVRESALGATLNQAQLAHSLVKEMDLSSFDQRAKSAWADCLELYEDMISLMDQSIGSTDPASSQTWLSAAITNHQTCQNGFNDFNLSSLLQSFPTMTGDFPKLLSNSLAINKVVAASSTPLVSDKQIRGRRLLGDGFPAWVSAGDRNLLQSTGSAVKADLVVAKDGSGNYRTITEAVAAAAAAKRSGSSRFVIHVKAGVYSENVEIKQSMKNLMFIGDGIDATVVTGNRNVQDGSTTFQSATFAVSGDGFIARDMTFQNTAGPQKHQAVALRSGSDLSVFYSCSFKGYQDTLYVYSQRQFYRNCDVYGTVDFIFGNAATVFQNCNIYVRKPMSNQKNTVTAQSRTDPNQNTGIIVHNSIVTAASDLTPVVASFQSYLGRPWQQYSRTVFMKCSLGSLIDPAGWLPWSGNFALSTLYYGEYMNTGAGASTSGRVRWAGYHVITSAAEASKFTVGNFLAGNSWIPATGVPFTAGL